MRIRDWSSDVCSSDLKLIKYTDFPARPAAPAPPNSPYRNNVEDLISRSYLDLPHLQGINDGDASIYDDEAGIVRFACRSLKPKCTLRLQTFILVQQSPLDGKGIEVDVRITPIGRASCRERVCQYV